jgi:VWFA-related protein
MMFFMAFAFMVLPAAAQEPGTPVFRAGVSLVKVDVQVTDSRGRLVEDLTAADFRVYDEGRPRDISYFGREAQPVDIALLLDVSGSMQRSIQQLAETARAALSGLHQGDRVALMLFAREAALNRPLTDDFGAVQSGIRGAVAARGLGSGTAINAAIIEAANYMAREAGTSRRAVLVVTDNLSLNYQVPDEEVLRALYGADAVLNAILIGRQQRPDPPPPGRYVNPDFTPSDVFKLADETGGEAMEARRVGDSFQQMIERIRARYGIHYEAPQAAPGEFRRIRVELTPEALRRHPRAVVRARAGYYAATP